MSDALPLFYQECFKANLSGSATLQELLLLRKLAKPTPGIDLEKLNRGEQKTRRKKKTKREDDIGGGQDDDDDDAPEASTSYGLQAGAAGAGKRRDKAAGAAEVDDE